MNTYERIELPLPVNLNAANSARTRYRNQALNWIALGVLLTAWQMEAKLDRDQNTQTDPRLAAAKPTQTSWPTQTRWEEPLWATEPRARSWITRAAARGVKTR
jgi:hypothetical protein